MTYADLIPNELQEELITLRDAHTKIDFRTGDVVALVVRFNQENQRPIQLMEIYSAVGAFVGRSSRTVRDYYNVACFYTHDVREQYTMLSFDHFRTAMRLGPEWESALQWAVEQVDELGRPATVDAMEAQFAAVEPDGETEAVDPVDPIDNSDGETDDPYAQVQAAITVIRRNLPKLGLQAGDTEQANEAVLVLEELLVRA